LAHESGRRSTLQPGFLRRGVFLTPSQLIVLKGPSWTGGDMGKTLRPMSVSPAEGALLQVRWLVPTRHLRKLEVPGRRRSAMPKCGPASTDEARLGTLGGSFGASVEEDGHASRRRCNMETAINEAPSGPRATPSCRNRALLGRNRQSPRRSAM
jgi:hypothetical protein